MTRRGCRSNNVGDAIPMKKKIKVILSSIIIIIALQFLIVIFLYPGYDHWTWLGSPSLPRIIFTTMDNYPGHSINCIKYQNFAKEWHGGKDEYIYDKNGEGINVAGINIHVGDTKSHVYKELRYGNLEEDEYNMVCYLCLWDWYNLQFEYDQNDILKNMTIKYVVHE